MTTGTNQPGPLSGLAPQVPAEPLQIPSARDFPRLHAFMKGLPQATSKYDVCQGKASMFNIALGLHPVVNVPEAMPDQLRRYFTGRLPPNQWVPELDYVMFSIAMADIHNWDNQGMRRYWFQVMDHINNSAMYGLLFRFLSARMLVTTVASRWSSFHQGTTCRAERTPKGLVMTLGFPRGLFNELIVHGYLGVFDALAAHSRLFKGQVELVDFDDVGARYLMRELQESAPAT